MSTVVARTHRHAQRGETRACRGWAGLSVGVRRLPAMAAELVELADDDGAADPWSVHLPGREYVPAYLVSRFAAQYRAIVDVLLAEQDSSLTGLSYDEIRAAVGGHLGRRLPAEVV